MIIVFVVMQGQEFDKEYNSPKWSNSNYTMLFGGLPNMQVCDDCW